MVYVRQNEEPYASVPYVTRTAIGGIADDKKFVRNTGCGICSSVMIVENLTEKHFTVEDCVKLSYQVGAHQWRGTNLVRLGPAIAAKFDLKYDNTDSIDRLTEHLKNGGMAIVLVYARGGKGLFTKGGHYMAAAGFENGEILILDPSYTDTKYETPERKDKVRVDYPFIYCKPEILDEETAPAEYVESIQPRYYLFSNQNQTQEETT